MTDDLKDIRRFHAGQQFERDGIHYRVVATETGLRLEMRTDGPVGLMADRIGQHVEFGLSFYERWGDEEEKAEAAVLRQRMNPPDLLVVRLLLWLAFHGARMAGKVWRSILG
jgi:hypothetical protein